MPLYCFQRDCLQIFEVQEHNVEDSIEMYISTLEKETRILLEVFRQTVVEDPARRLDLTVVLYHAVDVIHKVTRLCYAVIFGYK